MEIQADIVIPVIFHVDLFVAIVPVVYFNVSHKAALAGIADIFFVERLVEEPLNPNEHAIVDDFAGPVECLVITGVLGDDITNIRLIAQAADFGVFYMLQEAENFVFIGTALSILVDVFDPLTIGRLVCIGGCRDKHKDETHAESKASNKVHQIRP